MASRKMKVAPEDLVALAIAIFGITALVYNSIWLFGLSLLLMFLLSHYVMAKGMGFWVIVWDCIALAILMVVFELGWAIRQLLGHI